MRSLALTPLLVVSAAAALPEILVSKRDRHTNGATSNFARSIGIERRGGGTLTTNVYDVLSWSSGGAYYANVTMGSPPQDQVVIIDTGSSDLYLDASSAEDCQQSGQNSCRGGTFNPSSSSSYKVVAPAPAFDTAFGDGSTASGPFASDMLGIGDVSISNVQFGLAQEVDSTTGYAVGLLGIGYSAIEATRNRYANVPEVLVETGLINSRLYSVFLNDQRDISGSILFGGIDTSKYTGPLATLNLLPQLGGEVIDQFISVVTAVNATIGGKTHTITEGGSADYAAYSGSDKGMPVLLDTGSSGWSVDAEFYDKHFAPVFDFVRDDGLCSCAHATSGDFVSLEFGGKVRIKVPASEFIIPVYDIHTKQPVMFDPKNQACLVMISPLGPSESGFQTLGDAILRSMYLVYDLDNAQVSIAQASEDDSAKPNIVTVQAGPSGVAKAVSSVITAAANSYYIAPAVTTGSFSVSTLASTVGTATGTAAIPVSARISGNGGVIATGVPDTTSSPNAAAGLHVPGADFSGLWTVGAAAGFAALGAALIL